MKKYMIIGLVALAAVFAVGLQRQVRKVDEEVVGTFVGEDGKKIELLGACSITPDKVDCWDGQGVRSPALTERVTAHCLTENNSQLNFRFGMKNRFILMRAPALGQVNYEIPGFGYSGSMYMQSDSDFQTTGIRLSSAVSDKVGGVIATVPGTPVVAELALKVGEKVNVDGVEVVVGPSRPSAGPANPNGYNGFNPYMPGQPALGKYWSVVLGIPKTDTDYYGFQYAVLDKDHKPIQYVDLQGNPISAMTYLALGGGTEEPYYNPAQNAKPKEKPKCTVVQVQQDRSAQGATQVTMNVNPEMVGYLRITKSKQKRILFKDIPLDPKD